jgi:hypothetical protein
VLASLLVLGTCLVPGLAVAQQMAFPRLPTARFDVVAPSARVTGSPGALAVKETTCRSVPAASIRQRVVDVAVQEWAYFGLAVVDRTRLAEVEQEDEPDPRPRRRPRLPPEEARRLADSIAGYWTATPSASWILARQNEEWNGPDGVSARWRFPWSAAFISWVMCEGGLGATAQFQRAVAHHVYIDQAIRARDAEGVSAFTAHEVGDVLVEPGDLICSARRPAYRTMAERRRRLGEGARTHCDVVVRVDSVREQLLAIGGNVGGRVSLKVLPGTRTAQGLRPRSVSLGRRGQSAFVHLKMRGAPTQPDAMDRTPTLRALSCTGNVPPVLEALVDLRPRARCTE